MKQGALIFDERSDRYDIRFDLADYYGGLHCGETFDVMVGGRWKPTRIEYGANWYLVGIRADDLSGLRVFIFGGTPGARGCPFSVSWGGCGRHITRPAALLRKEG